MAGVPGLEPRMAVPETAVLPITPYPIGSLVTPGHRPLLLFSHAARRSCRGVVSGPRADYQRFATAFSGSGRVGGGMVPARSQPAQTAVTTQQFQRLEQRRADRRTGGRDPDRAERFARLELQLLQQRVLQGRFDLFSGPLCRRLRALPSAASRTGTASALNSLAADFSSSANSASLRNFRQHPMRRRAQRCGSARVAPPPRTARRPGPSRGCGRRSRPLSRAMKPLAQATGGVLR